MRLLVLLSNRLLFKPLLTVNRFSHELLFSQGAGAVDWHTARIHDVWPSSETATILVLKVSNCRILWLRETNDLS
jgi:hypothetical protein